MLLSSRACIPQAFEEPFPCFGELEPLSSPEASDELDESWLASMVAQLLTPGGDLLRNTNGAQDSASPELDSVASEYAMSLLQQPSQSNKRKRCFSADD